MEVKYELEQWHNGCIAHDREDYDTALRIFMKIGDNSKMHFNIGLIFTALQDHQRALAAFKRAIKLDPYFAVAYFQRGVSNFALGEWVDAYQDFSLAHKRLRGNPLINYHQLGLAYRLYECEVLFNRGICQLYMGKIDSGLTDLYYAQKARMTREHDIIERAIQNRGRGYSVYSIPPGVLYRPSRHKLEQLKQPWANDLLLGIAYEYTKCARRKNNSILLPTPVANHPNPGDVADLMFYTNALEENRGPLSAGTAKPLVGTHEPVSYLSPEEAEYLQDSMRSHLLHSNPDASIVVKSAPDTVKRPGKDMVTSADAKNSRESWKVADRRPKIDTRLTNIDGNRNNNNGSNGRYQPLTPVQGPSPVETSPTQRKPITGLADHNSYTRERHTDSGSVSTYEEKGALGKQYCYTGSDYKLSEPPPVPVAQHNQANYYEDFDTMSNYGNLDDELDKVYRSLAALTTEGSSPRSPEDGGVVDSYPKTEKFTADPRLATQTKLKIKVHHDDTRILLVPSNVTFDDLLTRVQAKFNAPNTIRLQYRDEDNEMVLMIDQDDLNMARRLARMRGNITDSAEKLEFWCVS